MFRYLLPTLLLLPAPLLADWPQWRGPHRSGVDPQSPRLIKQLPEEGLKPLWLNKGVVAKGRGEGWSSPVVADGKVFLFGHTKKIEHIACLDAKKGEELWHDERETEPTNLSHSSTPAVVDGRVFVMGARLLARCLDAKSGDEVWSRQLEGEVKDHGWQSSPLVVDGRMFVVASKLTALDARSGEVLWQHEASIPEGTHGSLTHSSLHAPRGEPKQSSQVIAHIGSGETIGVEPKTGKELWREKTEAACSSPLVVGDRLLTLGNSRKGGLRCYQLGPEGVELLWKYQAIADPGSCPVVVGDHVYVQGERRLACVNLADGKAAWTTDLEFKDPRYTSLVAANGQVLYALEGLLAFEASAEEFRPAYQARIDREGLLADEAAHRRRLGIDQPRDSSEGQKEGEKLWKQQIEDAGPVSCTSPALSDGRLYVRLRQGLACYELQK
jgi:outer membrane protein assembly factor BamB